MRLSELHIDGFGKLVDHKFQFSPGFNLIFGVNEAGKSTLQQAIVTMLYGFFGEGRRPKEEERVHWSALEPWNEQAIVKGVGVPVITDYEVWKNNPEKVFGVSKAWAEKNPNTYVHVLKAMIRAAKWLDEDHNKNRKEAAKILSRSQYVGADYKVIAKSMTGTFEYEKGDVRSVPDFNVFFRYNATYPYYSDAVWFLTQMRRWGQIPTYKPDSWYFKIAKEVYQPKYYVTAASELIKEGKMKAGDFPDFASETGFKPATSEFIDGVTYNGRKPNAYLDKFKIGIKGKEVIEAGKIKP